MKSTTHKDSYKVFVALSSDFDDHLHGILMYTNMFICTLLITLFQCLLLVIAVHIIMTAFRFHSYLHEVGRGPEQQSPVRCLEQERENARQQTNTVEH